MADTGAKEEFSSRWGLVLASMGAAVGTGNIWRFPREAALNGGGAFLAAWLIFLFLWSIPLLMAEFAIGKKTRLGTIGSFKEFVGKKYTWMGTWMVWVSAAINFYYAVVMGWTIRYFVVAASGGMGKGTDTALLWQGLIHSPGTVIMFQFLAMLWGGYVVYKGVAKGIEKTNKILLPTLIALLAIAALWALSLPGSIDGIKFLFIPKVEKFGEAEMWIRALSQSAWSCSAGMGMAITYAVYMKKKEDVGLNAFLTGFGNNSVSLIAGVAVLCTVFALSASTTEAFSAIESGSSGLTFIHLTNLFVQMPGGIVIAAIFFLAMAFAALTSLISGMEISVRNFMDHGWDRKRAIKFVAIASFAMGIPSAYSLEFLENQDLVWGIGLLISGLFVSFAVIKYGTDRFRRELINTEYSDIYIGKWWEIIIKFIFPLELAAMLVWFFMEIYTTSPKSLGLLILQWSLALGIMILLNNKIADLVLTKHKKSIDADFEVPDDDADADASQNEYESESVRPDDENI